MASPGVDQRPPREIILRDRQRQHLFLIRRFVVQDLTYD